eukprot:tig00000551_g2029.t1
MSAEPAEGRPAQSEPAEGSGVIPESSGNADASKPVAFPSSFIASMAADLPSDQAMAECDRLFAHGERLYASGAQKDYEEARTVYLSAVALARSKELVWPLLPRAISRLARVCMHLGRYEEGMKFLQTEKFMLDALLVRAVEQRSNPAPGSPRSPSGSFRAAGSPRSRGAEGEGGPLSPHRLKSGSFGAPYRVPRLADDQEASGGSPASASPRASSQPASPGRAPAPAPSVAVTAAEGDEAGEAVEAGAAGEQEEEQGAGVTLALPPRRGKMSAASSLVDGASSHTDLTSEVSEAGSEVPSEGTEYVTAMEEKAGAYDKLAEMFLSDRQHQLAWEYAQKAMRIREEICRHPAWRGGEEKVETIAKVYFGIGVQKYQAALQRYRRSRSQMARRAPPDGSLPEGADGEEEEAAAEASSYAPEGEGDGGAGEGGAGGEGGVRRRARVAFAKGAEEEEEEEEEDAGPEGAGRRGSMESTGEEEEEEEAAEERRRASIRRYLIWALAAVVVGTALAVYLAYKKTLRLVEIHGVPLRP